MRDAYDTRREVMVEPMRKVGFGISQMPQGAFHVFADVPKRTDDSCKFAFELLEKAGVGGAPGVDGGQDGKRAVRFSYGLGGCRSWARSRCHQTLPVDQDVKGAAPSVDLGQAGKRSVQFQSRQSSSMENS